MDYKHRLPTLTRILVTQMMQMSGGNSPDQHRGEEFTPTRAVRDFTLIPSTKKQEEPATSTLSSYLGAVHITTLKEMCKSKKLPMKKIRRQANHSSGLYLFPQLLPVGYKSKERGI